MSETLPRCSLIAIAHKQETLSKKECVSRPGNHNIMNVESGRWVQLVQRSSVSIDLVIKPRARSDLYDWAHGKDSILCRCSNYSPPIVVSHSAGGTDRIKQGQLHPISRR